MGFLSRKVDEKEKIVIHDKCYNAVSLAGNVRYLDFVLNKFELEL